MTAAVAAPCRRRYIFSILSRAVQIVFGAGVHPVMASIAAGAHTEKVSVTTLYFRWISSLITYFAVFVVYSNFCECPIFFGAGMHSVAVSVTAGASTENFWPPLIFSVNVKFYNLCLSFCCISNFNEIYASPIFFRSWYALGGRLRHRWSLHRKFFIHKSPHWKFLATPLYFSEFQVVSPMLRFLLYTQISMNFMQV